MHLKMSAHTASIESKGKVAWDIRTSLVSQLHVYVYVIYQTT